MKAISAKSAAHKAVVGLILALLGASLAVVVAQSAQAKSLAMSTVSSVFGSKHANDGCNVCVVVPAIVTKFSSSSSSSSSHVHIVVHKTVRENVHEFEKINHVVVGFNMMPNGLPSSMQNNCKWGDYAWSGWKTIDGKTVVSPNAKHGRTHACWDGHNWRQIGGGPGQWNCGNIVYPVNHPAHAVVVPRVVGFRSVKDFVSTFDKLVKKQSSSTSTSTNQTSYACPAGFNSVPGDVTHCQNCPPCPTTTTVTQPTTTTVHTTTTVPTTTTVQTTTTQTTTTTPSHFTNLTCQGQEEVTGGGSSLLVCHVSNDNGAEIALSVKVLSNKGNLLVSGVQCSSQGGTPSCQGAGTYEIRLGGVNDTSSPVYSDLEVKATSNGVPSDPFDQTYKIDPSSSNFGG